MKEEWRNLGLMGYPNYEVSNFGDVRSLNYARRKEIRLLQKIKDSSGYLQVRLPSNGNKKQLKIHRLVAIAFIPNTDNLPIINHKDEDPSNNRVDNLEWCTYEYNSNYGTAIDRSIAKRASKIYQYDLEGKYIKEWSNIGKIKEHFMSHRNCNRNIHKCCEGKRYTAYGYKWSYEKVEKLEDVIREKLDLNNYIYCYDLNYRFKVAIHGVGYTSNSLKVSQTCIRDCLYGIRKSAKGYVFSLKKYTKDEIKELKKVK